MKYFEPGQQIETEIVAITKDYIFLDLNMKTEGVMDRSDLEDEEGNISVKEGDKIKVYFVGVKDDEFRFTAKLQGEKADKSMLENAYRNKTPVEGKVEKEIKGGFEIKLGNARAFCPYSQMGFKQKEEASYYVGRVLNFMITEYKKDGRDILVSNRIIGQMEEDAKLEEVKAGISKGQTVKAKVVSLQKFGAFVEIDGLRALLPISEISHAKIEKVEDVLSVGQEITVKIIKTDFENNKFSVSMKELEANPWDAIADKFPVGTKVDGTISKITDFGLFVTVADGIDGLVHISELDIDRNTNLKAKFNVGDKFSVVVKEVNVKQQKMSLRSATSVEQDKVTAKYMSSQTDDGDTYNPFAALLKK
ncbi:MAG: S1 RNA-binding domain-containing protein [Treponemataceae bacterium]|nr:S1 RNA-binding domain-containing protein [Treponemataceae bacterium]